MADVWGTLWVAEPVPCPEKKNIYIYQIMQLGPDHNFHAVPSGKSLSEALMVVADSRLGGYSRPWRWPPAFPCSSSPFLGRRRPRRAPASAALCGARRMGFLSSLFLSCPDSCVLWYVEPLSADCLPIFSGFFAGCLAAVVRCTARGHVSPAIQFRSPGIPWVPLLRKFSPSFHAMQPACGSPLIASGHSPAGLGMDSRLGFASPCSLECMRPAVPPPRPRILQHRAHSQPSPNVGASAWPR